MKNEENNKQTNRIDWIDVAKAIGIVSILLGHFMQLAGKTYSFVFIFHVPLFFFLSGCVENFNKEDNIGKSILKAIKKILIPAYFFAILSLLIYTINDNLDIEKVLEQISKILEGCIRNQYFAGGIWFFTCLFVIKVMFTFIKKIKSKTIILIIGIVTFFIAELLIKPRPAVEPHWYYNIDSALYYLNYYIIGYLLYPYIEKLLKQDTDFKKYFIIIGGTIGFIYAMLLYFGFSWVWEESIIIPVINAYIIIFTIIVISYILRNATYIRKIGINTLYICGNEYIIKMIVQSAFTLCSLKIKITTPLSVYVYTIILIVLIIKILVPIEKQILESITGKR